MPGNLPPESNGPNQPDTLTAPEPSEFPFDTGRIEVPADLPASDALIRLISALLRPAPRDRPQTAAAARQILVHPMPEEPTTVLGTTAVTRLAPDRRDVTIVFHHGPRFVDMGPPPRDPQTLQLQLSSK